MSPNEPLSTYNCSDPSGLLPPTEADRITWIEQTAERCGFRTPGEYWLCLDLDSGEVILLPAKEYRRQTSEGAQLDRLAPITMLEKSKVDAGREMLRKMRSDPPN